jgi:phytol kinase
LFRPTIKNLLIFGIVWFLIGFVLGTDVLMGPVRWSTDRAREMAWSAHTESSLVRLWMVVLVAVSFIASLLTTAAIINTKKHHLRIGLSFLLLLSFGSVLWLWMSPEMMTEREMFQDDGNYTFNVGPYPTANHIESLKARGYTGVISLLHPAVIPFEPKLLADEKETAARVGIELIHLPMLPWISDNEAVLSKLKELATAGEGKYYIHCYLGKDRVSVARRAIESVGGSIKPLTAGRQHVKRLEGKTKLERGLIVKLEEDVLLIPFPTKEEFLFYILAGDVKNVVSILPSTNSAAGEKALLEQYGLNFEHMPISYTEYDPESALAAARRVWQMERPVFVHGFRNPSAIATAFLQAFRSNREPLSPLFFKRPLSFGKADVISLNVATGPRPVGLSSYKELWNRGVRKFMFIGNSESPNGWRDAEFTTVAEYEWHTFPSVTEEAVAMLESGSTWYVYGEELYRLGKKLEPPIPAGVIFDSSELKPEPEAPVTEVPAPALPKDLKEKVLAFVSKAIPTTKLAILLIPCFFLYAALSALYVGWLKKTKGVRTPYTRKVFHFLIFTMASVIQVAVGLSGVMMFGGVTALLVMYAVFRGKGFSFYEAMARPTDEPHRTFFILVPLITTALGGVLTNLFFAPFAHIGYLVGGWGDAVGEPVGTKWGEHRYKVPSPLGVSATRSLEGSLAVFLVSFAAALLGLMAVGFAPSEFWRIAAACAGAATMVEAISAHGVYNLTIQVAAAAVAAVLLGS